MPSSMVNGMKGDIDDNISCAAIHPNSHSTMTSVQSLDSAESFPTAILIKSAKINTVPTTTGLGSTAALSSRIVEPFTHIIRSITHFNLFSFLPNSAACAAGNVISPISNVVYDVSSHYIKNVIWFLAGNRNRRHYYKYLMKIANSYEQWAAAGFMLDRWEDNDIWKIHEESPYYDYRIVRDRLNRLREHRVDDGLKNLMQHIRSTLTRSLGNFGNPHLYEQTHVGTKLLIEDYIDEVTKQLNFVCDTYDKNINDYRKMEYFLELQKAFGRTALLLSGGGAFGLIHIGTIKAMFEMRMLPKIISGSSCGAIVAAATCIHIDSELPIVLNPELLNLDVFEVPRERGKALFRIVRLLEHGVVFDVEVFTNSMRQNLGEITFQEAFNRTRRILNITVSSSTNYEMPRLLNYLTSPNVLIWSAVVASCAVPFVYRSAPLMAKDANGMTVTWNPSGHCWIDGSVESDLPIQRISELFSVNHFIVAQVNPHVMPFMDWTNRAPTRFSSFVIQTGYLAQREIQHRLMQLDDLGIQNSYLSRIKSIICQKYWGDITIVPYVPWTKYPQVLSNPTVQIITDYMIDGERATWKRIGIIRNHLEIELCLNQNILTLKQRLFNAEHNLEKKKEYEDRSLESSHINLDTVIPFRHSNTMSSIDDIQYPILKSSHASQYLSDKALHVGPVSDRVSVAKPIRQSHMIEASIRRNVKSSSDVRKMKSFN
ncbi:Lipase 5 [Batrachochytrium dendrobatidis]|nr:Lipase 5 [Batrachochytrium dendrobatidis]